MSLIGIVANLFTGPIVNAVVDVVKDYNKTSVDRNKLEADVKKAVLQSLTSVAEKQSDVIIAEANSRDKFVRRWRPIVALSCGFILLFYALLMPIAVDWFGAPPVRIGDELLSWIFTLTSTMVGGYMAARTIEKSVKLLVSRWR